MTQPECPKEKCFFYIPPGGAADMSGNFYKDVKEAFTKGKWVAFPNGGCSCSMGKCVRKDPEGEDDFFEPMD